MNIHLLQTGYFIILYVEIIVNIANQKKNLYRIYTP